LPIAWGGVFLVVAHVLDHFSIGERLKTHGKRPGMVRGEHLDAWRRIPVFGNDGSGG
jgi:hypothetical protein